MSEDFLHHIWKFKLFDQFGLITTENESVEILKAGDHNFDSGPDFFNAKIKIGDTLWAGNVEVHINASDWNKHQHQRDKAYDNIVLHVVYNSDRPLFRSSGSLIPTIEIKSRIKQRHYHNYLNFKSSHDWIPCEKQIQLVPPVIIQSTIDKLLLERLERKSSAILESLKLNNNNWEETFYQSLARSFGFKTNAEPFELLAKSLPLIILAKHKSSLLQMEAMLFGQAGMLEEHFEDSYVRSLQNEYAFLKQKFHLQTIDKTLWKFLRMRPVNFPSVRIAQFAGLIFNSANLFSKILEISNVTDLKKFFEINVSEYWQTHYTFNKVSTQKSKHLGEDAINILVINTIIPFLFVYGKQKSEEAFVDKALKLLEDLPAEANSIIAKWFFLNIPIKSAYDSQALLQLKNECCNFKKCLNCQIGNYLLKNS